MTLVLATNNKHKIFEIRKIVGSYFTELKTLGEMGIDVDVEETGSTLDENALIKARAICELTGLPSLADDTGLMVDALDGAPGVYSARYAGEEHDDAKNRAKLLKDLQTATDRSAHFATCVALCYPDGSYILGHGRVEGSILFGERGENGFGYDSLFFSTELGRTFAEATAEEKNTVSHRARALHDLVSKLSK